MIGPDAWRYLALARKEPVVRPFHLRWLLPFLCGESFTRWKVSRWIALALSAGGMVALSPDQVGVAAAVLLVALPGVLGPPVARTVGIDVQAMACAIWAWVALEYDQPVLAVVLVLVAACIKESSPVWVALWAWSPIPLLGLVAVAVRALIVKPGMDKLTESNQTLRAVHEHPFSTALAAHRHQWRDAWIMVAPWGVCLAALYDASPQLLAVVLVAHLQLLIATDTVRLTHTAAGPALAIAAAQVIPGPWLVLALVLHVAWWRRPEFV